MEGLMALTVGWLYATGLYLMLRRSIVKMVIGLALLTNATNLLIFTAAGIIRAEPPIVAEGTAALADNTSDPLPQALVLTAIVIGFGIQAFAMALTYRVYRETGTDDPDEMIRVGDPASSESGEPPTIEHQPTAASPAGGPKGAIGWRR